MPQINRQCWTMRYLTFVLFLLSSSVVWAQCPGVSIDEANCNPITIYFETDPSGIGDYVRFTGTWSTDDSINHPTLRDNFLHGPVRWSMDGIVFAESSVSLKNRSVKTFLILDNLNSKLANAGIVLSADSQIFAEYVGEEFYNGLDTGCANPPGGPPTCNIAFEGSGVFADLQPRRVTYPSWDTTISTDKNAIQFTESVMITAQWELPGEFEQLGIDGRFYLFERDNMLGTVPIVSGTRQRHSMTNSTLAPGSYSFGAMYVGTEGQLNIISSDSVTVSPPKQSILLAVSPANPVTRAGAQGGPQVCVRGAGDTVPVELLGSEVSVDIYTLLTDSTTDIPSTTQAISLAADGCAAIATVGLTPGRYRVDATLVESDTYLRATAGGPLTIVSDDPDIDIVFEPEPDAGSRPVQLRLIAPRIKTAKRKWDTGESYVAIRRGIVFQAEVEGADEANNPGGIVQLFINGQFTSNRFFESGDATHIIFPALDLADGDYSAVLAYGGDATNAPHIGNAVNFDVSVDKITVPGSQNGLSRPIPEIEGVLDLELSLDVNNVIDGEPFVLTGRLRPLDTAYPRGVPAGTLVFLDGDVELGRAAITGYSGAILLPDGLPSGPHDLRVEFRQ